MGEMNDVFVAEYPDRREQKACYGYDPRQRSPRDYYGCDNTSFMVAGVLVGEDLIVPAYYCECCGAVLFDSEANILKPIVDLLEEIRGLLNV